MADVRLLPPLQRARAVHALDLARGQLTAAPGAPLPPAGPRSAQLARLAELGRRLPD